MAQTVEQEEKSQMTLPEDQTRLYLLGLSLLLAVVLGISACSTAGDESRKGTLRGEVTSRLHHGVPPEDGEPSTTTSPAAGTWVLIASNDDRTNPVDSVVTDSSGHFQILLPVGTWILTLASPHGKEIPTGLPSPVQVEIVADSVTRTDLRFEVYAP